MGAYHANCSLHDRGVLCVFFLRAKGSNGRHYFWRRNRQQRRSGAGRQRYHSQSGNQSRQSGDDGYRGPLQCNVAADWRVHGRRGGARLPAHRGPQHHFRSATESQRRCGLTTSRDRDGSECHQRSGPSGSAAHRRHAGTNHPHRASGATAVKRARFCATGAAWTGYRKGSAAWRVFESGRQQ